MAKAYLLTGLKKVGKTTTIEKIVDLIGRDRCGGFYTKEVLKNPNDKSSRIAFKFKTLTDEEGIIASIDSNSNLRVGKVEESGLEKYGVELKEFEEIAVKAISDALENKKFIIIDEIGHMQLFSNEFKKAVKKVMESDKTLIGTIVLKSHFWADWFKEKYSFTEQEMHNGEALSLNSKCVAEIYHMTFTNRDNLNKMLLAFFDQKFRQ